MTFEVKLAPLRAYGESISASVVMRANQPRLLLRFSTKLTDHVVDPRCDVIEGTDLDAGRLLIKFGEQGAFGAYKKQTPARPALLLFVPVPACAPQDYLLKAVPCDHSWRTPRKELVVTLNVAAWQANIEKDNA